MCIYDVYGPCSCPHGRCFTVLAQCFTIASWVCSVVAVTSCFYMYVRPIPEEGAPELPREGFGYLSRQIKYMEPPQYTQCVFWDAEEKELYFDDMWRAGKAMSLIAVGIGFVVMLIVMCTCCVAFQLRTFEGLFWTSMFCFVAQALTFLAWGSDLCEEYECTWSSGTGMNITAAMLWVWAANMIKSFPEALAPRGRGRRKPLYDDRQNGDPDDDGVYEDEYDYDGEEGDFSNRDEYYDDYDDDYFDDQQNYEDQEGYEDQDYEDDNDEYSKYDTDKSEDPRRRQQPQQEQQDGDNDSNSYFDDTTDDQSRFSRTHESNAFKESAEDLSASQASLSQEERRLLDGDDKESSFRGID